jgi:hypothetical protein
VEASYKVRVVELFSRVTALRVIFTGGRQLEHNELRLNKSVELYRRAGEKSLVHITKKIYIYWRLVFLQSFGAKISTEARCGGEQNVGILD